MITEEEIYSIQNENAFMHRIIPENIEEHSLEAIKEQLQKDEYTINVLVGEILDLQFRLDEVLVEE